MEDEGRGRGSSDFGALLRRYRLTAGLSQEMLAGRARVSLDGISALERGYRRTPQRETVALLARALALTDEQRAAFEAAAARPQSPRRRGETSVTVGPWAEAESASLPVSLTTFVGRDAELDEIGALVRKHRLVTITGTGGVGKTQTALRAANGLNDVVESIHFVALAPVGESSLVASAIATALGVQEVPNRPLLEMLTAYLKTKASLLLLDNCEHLVGTVAVIAQVVLGSCPRVRILATSREPLASAGERVYRLPSLTENDGVALFADRAQAVDAHFALSDENAPTVGEICRHLDGIPLAIELAAARANMWSVLELVGKLGDRFKILKGGERTALPRQQTMRAAIDWSYNLLSRSEQRLLERLSVFAGGCTAAAAIAVCASGELAEDDILDLLSILVAKSLVLAESDGDATRYRLLESTRAYAGEKLADAGERDAIAGWHLRYFRDLFGQLQDRFREKPRPAELIAALRTELADVRLALDGALARSAVLDGAKLLANTSVSWRPIGLEAEGTARYEAYLAALPANESHLRARLSTELSYLLGVCGERLRAFEIAAQAVEQARASGDDSLVAKALRQYAQRATVLCRFDEAERAYLEAEAMPETSVSHRMFLLGARAAINWFRGDLETASRMFEQLREKQRSLGDTHGEQNSALNLAEVEYARGRTHQAVEILKETLPAVRAGADKVLLVNLLVNLAGYLSADEFNGATATAREAITIHSELEPEHPQVILAIEQIALVSAMRGDLARAALLEGYADAVVLAHKVVRDVTSSTTATHERLTALLRKTLAPEELARLSAKGAALASADAIALALDESDIPPQPPSPNSAPLP